MIALQSRLSSALSLQTHLSFAFGRGTKMQHRSFNARIRIYNKSLDYFNRVFLMRPPNLKSSNPVSFPLKMPMLVRHIPKRIKNPVKYQENSEKIRWNRLSPNQILLALEKIEYLGFNELVEGLQYLSEVRGQEKHNWNRHPWVSKAFEVLCKQYARIRPKDKLSMYYLLQRLNCKHEPLWKKIYADIEENIYDLPTQEFEKFFMKYYKVSDQYFSPEMKQKWLTLMENRLRSFTGPNIVDIFEIFDDEDRLDHYWMFNVFVPLFKNNQYHYRPRELQRIFRFMMIHNHEVLHGKHRTTTGSTLSSTSDS